MLLILQVAQLGKTLRAVNFLEDKDIQLVAHSPLIRARQTSHGMLGCVTRSEHAKLMGDESWKGEKADCVPKVVELPELAERTIFEWVPIHHDSFMERISLFEKWYVCVRKVSGWIIIAFTHFSLEADKFDS